MTNIVELGVGVACLIATAATWRRPGLRALAAIFLVAGLAAAIHAVVALA
jgi:hypothetical protein